jgi:hypothetical protein
MPAHGPSTDVQADESNLPLLENDVNLLEGLRNPDGESARRAYFCFPPLMMTRKRRIDPRLRSAIVPNDADASAPRWHIH